MQLVVAQCTNVQFVVFWHTAVQVHDRHHCEKKIADMVRDRKRLMRSQIIMRRSGNFAPVDAGMQIPRCSNMRVTLHRPIESTITIFAFEIL
jgi:hypothetical protein